MFVWLNLFQVGNHLGQIQLCDFPPTDWTEKTFFICVFFSVDYFRTSRWNLHVLPVFNAYWILKYEWKQISDLRIILGVAMSICGQITRLGGANKTGTQGSLAYPRLFHLFPLLPLKKARSSIGAPVVSRAMGPLVYHTPQMSPPASHQTCQDQSQFPRDMPPPLTCHPPLMCQMAMAAAKYLGLLGPNPQLRIWPGYQIIEPLKPWLIWNCQGKKSLTILKCRLSGQELVSKENRPRQLSHKWIFRQVTQKRWGRIWNKEKRCERLHCLFLEVYESAGDRDCADGSDELWGKTTTTECGWKTGFCVLCLQTIWSRAEPLPYWGQALTNLLPLCQVPSIWFCFMGSNGQIPVTSKSQQPKLTEVDFETKSISFWPYSLEFWNRKPACCLEKRGKSSKGFI